MLIHQSFCRSRRRAVAAVEFAFLSPLLVGLLLGLWQVGRIIQVSQILNNAAREGARLAATSQIVALVGGFTLINTSTGEPNVQDTVREYLFAAGVVNATTVTDVQVQFNFVDAFPSMTNPPYTPYPPSAPYQPWMGIQGQRFTVTVTLPIQDINWTPITMTGNLSSTVEWANLVDQPFTVNTTVPGWNAP